MLFEHLLTIIGHVIMHHINNIHKSALKQLSYRSITQHNKASGTVIQQHPIVMHILLELWT